MHCDCCDVLLSDYESSIKFLTSDMYANTCLKCLKEMNLPYKGNSFLEKTKDKEDEQDKLVQDFFNLMENDE